MINIRARGEREDSSDLTSLIDVVFILLIFFILAALAGHVVEIRLNKDGSFLCDGIPTKKEELDERLASVIIQFKARPGQIVLMADPQAPAGEMIYLVDAVRQHGGEKLHVATSPRGEK